jgi:hypothetical protein
MSVSEITVLKFLDKMADSVSQMSGHHSLKLRKSNVDAKVRVFESKLKGLLNLWGKCVCVYAAKYIDNYSVADSSFLRLDAILKPLNGFNSKFFFGNEYTLWMLTPTSAAGSAIKQMRRSNSIRHDPAERQLAFNIAEAFAAYNPTNLTTTIVVVAKKLGPSWSDEQVFESSATEWEQGQL